VTCEYRSEYHPVILMTGGSRGIGAATAILAAQKGYQVCITYKGATAAAEAVVNEIRTKHRVARAIQADISEEADVLRLFATIDTVGPLKALVNNAGVVAIVCGLERMTVDRWMNIMTTNVIGTMLCTREVVKRMSARNGVADGVIVNVSSGAAKTGAPHEYVDYAASKGAIDTLTIGIAREITTQGIRVKAVRPGLVQTEIRASSKDPNRVDRLASRIPMGRGGQPSEIAAAIVWLVSDESSYMTGSIIDVIGGM
jgi:NAD(P)-dependent dehydrogenase (short-subunit alcohol dehydrogenase family)